MLFSTHQDLPTSTRDDLYISFRVSWGLPKQYSVCAREPSVGELGRLL